MKITERIASIFSKDDLKFKHIPDTGSLNFVLPQNLFEKCSAGMEGGEISQAALHQFIALQMLAEQGLATPIANGFCLENEDAVRLDEETRKLLELPSPWPGSFDITFEHHTQQASFRLNLILKTVHRESILHYDLQGPLLKLTDTDIYLPSPEQWVALKTVEDHKHLKPDQRNEYQNLKAIHQLKTAQAQGCKVALHHFENFQTQIPEHITVTGRILETGDMLLSPQFDDIAEPDEIEDRLHQLEPGNHIQSLRVEDTFILLDENKLNAVHEIITNRKIPKNQIQDFFKTPTAFLDANLVDLDLGFSLRVRGATPFKHAYFGETDASGISWFESALQKQTIQPVAHLNKVIPDLETFQDVEKRIKDAEKTGAGVVEIKGVSFDISDSQQTGEALRNIKETLELPPSDEGDAEVEDEAEKPDTESSPEEPWVVDVIENDETVEYSAREIQSLIENASYKGELDFTVYKRFPFPHQQEGIRWLLGLALKTLNNNDAQTRVDSTHGALLADDMGLGKTYMALVSVAEYYKTCREKDILERPVLVVAPLSILENWQDEVHETFAESPFRDIVILQAAGDLQEFKLQGVGIEIRQNADALLPADNPDACENAHDKKDGDNNGIRYVLKVGKAFGSHRLDIDRRLVITTYQTLRDYQFSLCRIDWSFVIFDEAQHIKNPNTLATRAAKGLKAQFKLLATGTPVENHLGDFWCLLDTASPGTLGAYQSFRETYINPIRQAGGSEVSQVRLDVGRKLRKETGALMLRRLKEDHIEGLPSKIFHLGIKVKDHQYAYHAALDKTMQGEQLQRYNTIIDVVLESKEQEEHRGQALSGLHRLREISLHPLLLNQGTLNTPENSEKARDTFKLSGKLHSLLSILDEKKILGEKVIIFLINKRLQTYLKASLDRIYKLNINIINGDTKAVAKSKWGQNQTRKTFIQNFESQPGFGILIMSPIAAGTGFTIVSANNVIHLERHWNPAKEDQATDRVYRIGQQRDVNVYLPILKHPQINSFDVNLHGLLSQKTILKDAVVTPEEVSGEDMCRSNFINFDGVDSGSDEPLDGNSLKLLSWQEFEAFCAELYRQYYEGTAALTPPKDHGADVVVLGRENVLIQCKSTSQKKYNSLDSLKDVYFSKPGYEEKMNKSFQTLIAATNANGYSKRVLKEAETYDVQMVSRKTLEKLLKKFPVTRGQIQRRLLEPRLFE